jgi:hypothetical protein
MKNWLVSDPRGKIFYSIKNWAIPILILSLGSGYLQIDFPGQLVGRHRCGLWIGWLACFAPAAGLWLLGLLGSDFDWIAGLLLLGLWLLGTGCSGCWAVLGLLAVGARFVLEVAT